MEPGSAVILSIYTESKTGFETRSREGVIELSLEVR